jgi:hypothetical protein
MASGFHNRGCLAATVGDEAVPVRKRMVTPNAERWRLGPSGVQTLFLK